jgi:hypothetical protein
MSRSSPRATPPLKSPIQGNTFEYYFPKNSLPKPTPPTPVKGKKTVKAHQFIKTHFNKTLRAPSGSRLNLNSRLILDDIDIMQAALECGYGKRIDWTAKLVLNPAEAQELAYYLTARIHMLLACIRLNTRNARELRTFYKAMESSEKTALSFLAGSIGAFFSAKEWINASGDKMQDFLHLGIYAKSMAGRPPHVAYTSHSSKWPDYLVHTSSGCWHVFESKGGSKGSRWQRLVEGLRQLDGTPHIGWAGTTATPATSLVCAHTSVDPGKPMHFTVVDPPPDLPRPEQNPPIELIKPVARLMKYLEAIQQFRALTGTKIESRMEGNDFWTEGNSNYSQILRVLLPRKFLEHEAEIRERLGIFIAIRDKLRKPSEQSHLGSQLAQGFRLDIDLHQRQNSLLWVDTYNFLTQNSGRTVNPQEISEVLNLQKFSEIIDTVINEAHERITHSGNTVITTGGLCLKSVAADGATDAVVAETASPRS